MQLMLLLNHSDNSGDFLDLFLHCTYKALEGSLTITVLLWDFIEQWFRYSDRSNLLLNSMLSFSPFPPYFSPLLMGQKWAIY